MRVEVGKAAVFHETIDLASALCKDPISAFHSRG